MLRSRVYRALDRMLWARGALLAAGIAFYGVFSLFPLLILGFTTLGLFVGRDALLQRRIIAYLDSALPGLVGAGDDVIVTGDQLLALTTDPKTLGVSALIGLVTLLITGLGWIFALREGVRGMFELPMLPLDIVRAKLFDLLILLTLGSLIVTSALIGVVANAVTRQLLMAFGLDGTTFATVVTRLVVGLGVLLLNAAVFTVLYRVLANTSARYRSVVGGALIAAVGIALMQPLLGVVLGSAAGTSGFLGAAALSILALFVFLNLNARVILFGAAWVAVGRHPDAEPVGVHEPPVPAAGARQGVPLPPVLPERTSDRVVLGAGLILGATLAGLAQLAGGAVRAVGSGVRELLRDSGDRDR